MRGRIRLFYSAGGRNGVKVGIVSVVAFCAAVGLAASAFS
jgi:hypothetical protein